MLNQKIIKKINDYVYIKPRTIQEISLLINKNWRTANSYIEKIKQEQGTISIRIFREGTRGALKIVYWNSIEKIHSSQFQERLFQQISTGKHKEDFSPSEIYQYIDKNKKSAQILNEKSYYSKENFQDYQNFLKSTQQQILLFSGNLSFLNLSYKNKNILQTIEDLAKNNISIKILTRVELPGIENIKNTLSINEKLGKNLIEIHHCFQPLRCTIIDSKIARIKEVKDPKVYPVDELKEKLTILYTIHDEEWIEWLQKVFFNLFRKSISEEKRIEDIENISFIK